MSEVEWRGRAVPVKVDRVRIFLLGLADNEAAIAQVRAGAGGARGRGSKVALVCRRGGVRWCSFPAHVHRSAARGVLTVSGRTLLNKVISKLRFSGGVLRFRG